MKAAFYTLGCKVNQNETGALEELFRHAGFTVVAPEEAADVFVVNSCTVTAAGDAKSRRALHRAKTLNPGVVTVLTGCAPQAFPKETATWGADVITGTAQRARLLQNVRQCMATGRPVVDIAPMGKQQAFEELPAAPLPGRTRAFVKIQDGCSRHCAYCVIPTARGPARSREEGAILRELAALAAQGYREVVFTGINLSSYGQDTHSHLAAITRAAASIKGLARIRLSSLEPDLLTDAQIDELAQIPQFCRQFHLSLQSGCNATLRRMRRPYTAAQYAQTMQKLRDFMPDASFTTDVIVGFPGESEADFEESLAFVKAIQFLKVHVFPFSARAGTPAAVFENQLPKSEKTARAAHLQKEADAVRAQWILARQGTAHEVLLEAPLPNGHFSGYTKNYIPVSVFAPNAKQGDIVSVTLGAFEHDRCPAVLLQGSISLAKTRQQ